MSRKFTDNAKTTLSGAISAVATTLTVVAGKGDLFPQVTGAGTPGATPNFFIIKVKNAAGVIEKIRVEHRAAASDVLGSAGFPLIRGYDGTVAQAWSVGDFVSLTVERVAAQGWEDGFNAAALGRAFGYKDSTTAGLNFGYYGGLVYSGSTLTPIADGTVALTASQTNFIERTLAGVVSANTSAFTAGRVPLYTATTDATGITSITDKRATLMQDKDGGLTVGGNLTASSGLTVGGNLTVSGVGPHAIGGAVNTEAQLSFAGAFTGSSNSYGILLTSTLNPGAGGGVNAIGISPTINKAGSGTHVNFASLAISPPSIGAGGAALVNATTLQVNDAPSVGTNQRALWVVAGMAEFGGLINLSGGQLKFPATQAASGDANTLDDYEEGTWTPSVGGSATYNVQIGSYTKIGNRPLLTGVISVASIGTGSTTTISGLPFVANGTHSITLRVDAGSATNIVSSHGFIGAGATTIVINSRTAASAADAVNAIFAAGALASFSGHYAA